jgi:hypothetical protein
MMATPEPCASRAHGIRFLILFPGRTGSSWLVSALQSHPDVRADGEILVKQDAGSQRRMLEERYASPPDAGTAIGFKTKLKDVADLEGLRRRIESTPLHLLLMRRADLIRLAISRITARRLHQHSGRWNLDDRTSAAPTRPIEPPELLESIEHCLATVEELDRFVSGLPVPIRELEYADILTDPAQTLSVVQRFLGVSPQPLHSGVRKNTDQDLHLAVPNLSELLDRIADSRWSPLLSRFDARREVPPPH